MMNIVDCLRRRSTGQHKEMLVELQQMMKRVKADKHYQPYWRLRMPQDHSQQYDHIIAVLEASLDIEFELTSREFAQFVRPRRPRQPPRGLKAGGGGGSAPA